MGTMLVQYALTWYIALQTKSGIMATIAILAGFLPTFFLSPFGGVWADRYNRKTLIMLADSAIAVVTLLMAFLFFINVRELYLIFLLMAVRALGTAVQTPAVNAFIPEIVPRDQLLRVSGITNIVQPIIMLISPMAGAALMSVLKIEYVFFVDVGTAAIAVAVLGSIKHQRAGQEFAKKSLLTELLSGWRYVLRHKYLKLFIYYVAVFYIMVAPAAYLTQLQVVRTFHGTERELGVVGIAYSLGMILGGLLVSFWGGFKNRMRTLGVSALFVGCMVIMLGLAIDFWVYIACVVMAGLTIPLFNAPANVMLQERVEPEFIGRVFSLMGSISSITMPIAMLVFGPLADLVPIEALLLSTGPLLIVLGVLFLCSRTLTEAGWPLELSAPVAEKNNPDNL